MNEADLIVELVNATANTEERSLSADRIAAAIRRFGSYRWVGIYDVNMDGIAILAWDGPGPPVHPRFPRTEGLSGAAVATGRVIIVDNVESDPRYLPTLSTTRSEIIVPISRGPVVVGFIDVESDRPRFFTSRDEELLERCAAVITPLWP